MSNNIFQILNFLPADIVNRIIPYTYQPQGNPLMRDVENFYTTRLAARELYFFYVVMFGGEPEPSDWLIKDIFGLSNQYSYVDYFYNLFLRNRFLKTRSDVFKYIQKTEKKEVNTQINIFWGLFNIEERNIFLENINSQ